MEQFVSRDVIVSADANPYRYVRSSPVNFTDPSGRGPCGQPVWDADLGRYVDPLYEQWAAEARQRRALSPLVQAKPARPDGFWSSIGSSLYSMGLTWKGIYEQVSGNPNYMKTHISEAHLARLKTPRVSIIMALVARSR